MTPQELDMLRHYLTAFGSRKEAEPMTLRLMDILLASKAPMSDGECSKKLYGKAKDNRYEKLKSRLKQKALDSLINDINIDRNKEWDDIELVTIKLRKKLAQYYFLSLSKPNQPMIQHLLDEIILVAKKYESYPVLTEALKFKKFNIGFKSGQGTYNKLNEEILHYEECQIAVSNAADVFFRMLLMQNFNSNIEKRKYLAFLKKNIKLLKNLYSKTNSSSVLYYLNILYRNLYVLIEDYESAGGTCRSILDDLEKNPAIYRKQRVGSTYLFLSQFELENNRANEALQFAKNAKEYFPKKSINYFAALDAEFHALWELQNYIEALTLAAHLVKENSEQKGSFRSAKYVFYGACTQFQRRDFGTCLKSLLTNNALAQDKSGWDLGLRTLIILTHVELGNYDLASNAVEALRKHIERRDRDKAIRPRDKVIYQVLRSLSDASFNFALTWKQEQAKISLLQSDKPNYRWEHLGHELVRVDNWIKDKVRIR